MGRWAQSKRRGSQGAVVDPRTVPPSSEQWALAQGGEPDHFGLATIVDPGSAPTDQWQMRWRVNGGAWTLEGPQDVATDLDTAMTAPGDTVEAEARWYDSITAAATSDWSAIKSYVAT